MQTALLILGVLFLLSQSGRTATVSTAPRATGTTTPTGGTRISIPGVGEYFNLPGGTTSITFDPTVFGSLFPSPEPQPIASPTAAPDYQAYDLVSAPVDAFPYGDYGFLAV